MVFIFSVTLVCLFSCGNDRREINVAENPNLTSLSLLPPVLFPLTLCLPLILSPLNPFSLSFPLTSSSPPHHVTHVSPLDSPIIFPPLLLHLPSLPVFLFPVSLPAWQSRVAPSRRSLRPLNPCRFPTSFSNNQTVSGSFTVSHGWSNIHYFHYTENTARQSSCLSSVTKICFFLIHSRKFPSCSLLYRVHWEI